MAEVITVYAQPCILILWCDTIESSILLQRIGDDKLISIITFATYHPDITGFETKVFLIDVNDIYKDGPYTRYRVKRKNQFKLSKLGLSNMVSSINSPLNELDIRKEYMKKTIIDWFTYRLKDKPASVIANEHGLPRKSIFSRLLNLITVRRRDG